MSHAPSATHEVPSVDATRISPRINVTIEAEQRQKVVEQCQREHRTQSEVIRLALRLYYDHKDEFGRPVSIIKN